MLATATMTAAAEDSPRRETLVVTATRSAEPELDTLGNIARLSEADILTTAALHPHELAVRVPGVWIGRGSGQEHLTAIRSPVLTGPGSCGAFLVMEDGIPTRPAGFCNVNQLFEVPSELASAIEVIRGPANALYGSNGLHGTVNVLLPEPGTAEGGRVSLLTGSNDFLRGRINWDSGPAANAFAGGLLLDRDGGYREESGYRQAKLYGKSRHDLAGGELGFSASASWLDQDTAGFITGKDAYKGADRFRNENPEAYREASSLRLSTSWLPQTDGQWQQEYRGYLRNSQMKFLQHFLPGQPTEKNGQTSGGLMFLTRNENSNGVRLTLGLDAELASGRLEEDQADGNQPGFAPERPDGLHYDYRATSAVAAAFANVMIPLGQRWELEAGLRGEYLRYDYDNRMLAGNSKEDGTPCIDQDTGLPVADFPPDGCLYSRPNDRKDDFFNLAPKLGALYRFNENTVGFLNAARGFRAPQATELYRLQAPQDLSKIDSEQLDQIELGMRHEANRISVEAVGFYMRKENFIFRDSAGFNVSDGKTRHYGVETNLNWRITEPLYLSFVGSYAKQKYDFDRDAGLGEVIRSGNEIDTAPQILASARVGYEYRLGLAELEWVHQDPYFMDAANTERYEGHDLLNLRLLFDATDAWQLGLRINNLTDEAYADRADIAAIFAPDDPRYFRYFPGHEREIYFEVTWRSGGS
jgi:outer membrane receptor protein involved in Fe transport